MAVTSVPTLRPDSNNADSWSGGVSTADDDVLLTIGDARAYEEYVIATVAGAVDVFVSMDGSNWIATAVGLMNYTDNAPDAETTAGVLFQLKGVFRAIRFMQDGATGVSGFGVTAKRSAL